MKLKPPKVVNETNLDGRRVGGVVRWVFRYLDVNGANVIVKVKHHTGRHAVQGRYYHQPLLHKTHILKSVYGYDEWVEVGPKVPPGTRGLIVCRIAKPSVYPVTKHYGYDRKDSPPEFVCANWEEALVAITAHEAMHLRHFQVPKSRNRGRTNETDTQWAAYRLWKEWRETH